MAAQQIQIAETIRAMKLALKRRPDDADDDSDTQPYTNRGNKLKRRAQHTRSGQLDNTGRLAHRRHVSHAGYTRATISTNPPLYDSDGEPYSPTTSDIENDRHIGEPVEEDPFGQVQLEHLLKPLTAAHELCDHPGLSQAFKSKALTQMAQEAMEMVRRERESLWKAKRLLGRFRGDADWVPCETFEGFGDEMLLNGQAVEGAGEGLGSAVPSITMEDTDESVLSQPGVKPAGDTAVEVTNGLPKLEDVVSNGVHATDMAAQPGTGEAQEGPSAQAQNAPRDASDAPDSQRNQEQDTTMTEAPEEPAAESNTATNGDPAIPNPTVDSLRNRSPDPAASESASNSGSGNTHAMTTRRGARPPSPRPSASPSPSPSDSASIPPVHPWFLAPATSMPDRDVGLPYPEAEESRKLLLLYCQKQEQIVRSLESLYSGLQKADRLRHYVYESAKASGHLVENARGEMVTEMSDGEDWYDVEQWGLQVGRELNERGTLEKGKDEVEDVEEEGRRGVRKRRVQRVM